MRTFERLSNSRRWLYAFCAVLVLWLMEGRSLGQGTMFTYQGELSASGAPANGVYDFQFAVFDAATGGTQQGSAVTVTGVGVTNGVFSTGLDFGNVFAAGAKRWLSISVRTNGSGTFTGLDPRQEVTPTPYAITAGGVKPGGITSTMIGPNAITSEKIADGAVKVTDIDDEGAREYESAVQELAPLGLGEAVAFESMKPMVSVTGGLVSMTLTLSGGLSAPVLGFAAEEAISEVPVYLAQVRVPTAYDLDGQVGTAGTVRISRNAKHSYFHGVVTAITVSARQSSSSERMYTVRLEPPLSALRYSRDYRVRLEMRVTDVISSVLSSVRHSLELSGSYGVRSQFIQFGETPLNFISRLMEEEGIYYFVEQEAEEAQVIITDSQGSFRRIENALPYYGNNVSSGIAPGTEHITDFKKAARLSTGKTTAGTFYFELPNALRVSSATSATGIGEEFVYIQWNGTAVQVPTGLGALAAREQARNQVEAYLITGESTAPDLHAGYVFTLDDRTAAGFSGEYVVTRVQHGAFVRNRETTYHYANKFEAIPAKLPFRPARVTPRPEAHPTTATVAGPAGETIYADQYGRVKVQFHWDRYGSRDQNSSAWVRVATPMAGAQSGLIFLPEVGDEVLVSFVQGDPDAPVIVGSLWNAAKMPPYQLPNNRTSAGIRMRSTDNGVNEVRFESKAGAQQLSINAARDLELNAGRQIHLGGPVSINGGNAINKVQSGQALAGAGTSGSKTVTFSFPTAFARPPKVIVTPEHEPGWNVSDTFVATVKSVSTTACTVNIVRVDVNGGWNMALRLNWIAWD